MKLLIVLPKLAGAGAEIFVSRLALSLSRKGVEVRIYLLSGVSDNVGEKYLKQFIRSGVHVYHNGNQSHKSVRCLVRYLATIYRWKPNIVFSNLFVSRFYSIFAKMIFRGTRYIDRIENTVICTGRKKYLHLLVPYFQDRTVVISPPVMKKYAEFNSNRNNHKMRLIPNGVEIPATGNQHTDFLDHGSNVSICHVGRI